MLSFSKTKTKTKKKMRILLYLFFVSVVLGSCSFNKTKKNQEEKKSVKSDTTVVDFWNGNRSSVRQDYELEVLKAVLASTESDYGPWKIKESIVDYPGNAESLVFSEKNHDLFVTVAGNQKFEEGDMISIPRPLTKNLLGYRVLIIRAEDSLVFNAISDADDLRQLKHGIPSTWSDATIFRHNEYQVVEDGDFDDIFERLESGLFDYSAYGANEVLSVFEKRASKQEGLIIDDNIMLFYPFPLVFYVNPERLELSKRVEQGLQNIEESGALDDIFNANYSNIVEELNLDQRKVFILENPLIPEEFANLKPDLTDF
jgi:hypothetical protein